MDIQPQTTKPISDDQELAKVLAGVTQQADAELNFEETPLPQPNTSPKAEEKEEPEQDEAVVAPVAPEASQMSAPEVTGELGDIKKSAITDLRPLVDKLNLSPDEKFDIYLLILRSTDDATLIAPAYAAARNIVDETKRAQSLLDVIKEIDYLSSQKQQAL